MKKKYLMFDRKWMVHEHGRWEPKGTYNFKICVPEKNEHPLMVADKPWEAMSTGWHTLIHDAGRYRLWYEAWDETYKSDADGRLCYAESDDCINWKKPELGLVEYRGSRKNNILIDGKMTFGLGFHGHSVFVDPSANPSERYKLIFLGMAQGVNSNWPGVCLIGTMYSSDGFKWNMKTHPIWDGMQHPMLSYISDTQTVAFWDAGLHRYVGFFRSWEHGYGRCVARAETPDFHEWRVPVTVLRCDENDVFTADIYNNAATRYESAGDVGYFFFMSMFEHNSDRLNVQVATSRDTYTWSRSDRTVFIDNGPGDFDAGGIYVAPTLVPFRKGLALGYHGVSFKHAEATPSKIQYKGCLNIVTMPVDRIQGLNTDDNFEFVLAGTLLESGKLNIKINADIRSKGEIRTALLFYDDDAHGFKQATEFEDCVPLQGNVIEETIKWNKMPVLDKYVGKKVFLRVRLIDAVLYAVEVES